MDQEAMLDRFIGPYNEGKLTGLGKLAVAAKRVLFDVWGGGWINLYDTEQRSQKVAKEFRLGAMINDYGATFAAILGTILMVTHETPAFAAVPVMVLGRMAYGIIVGVIRETTFATGVME